MKKSFNLFLFVGISSFIYGQELYVFTEPASNMPAHSMTAKLSLLSKEPQRLVPELMFGFSKKFMLHTGVSFSNQYSPRLRWESVYLYGKYRFLSFDDVHRHFRMAAFAELSHSRNSYRYDEVTIRGDRSGASLGLIATGLIHRFALSLTASNVQAMDPSRTDKIFYVPERIYQSMDYSVSAGFLLLPFEYKNYKQLNVNLYSELLGQKTIERGLHYTDLATAIQLIFNSNSKLNLGYRFELNGNEYRGMKRSYLVSFEHTFFNVLKKS